MPEQKRASPETWSFYAGELLSPTAAALETWGNSWKIVVVDSGRMCVCVFEKKQRKQAKKKIWWLCVDQVCFPGSEGPIK